MYQRAKYKSQCHTCHHTIHPGTIIAKGYRQRKWSHKHCVSNSSEDRQYAQGIADGERYQNEKAAYGKELADQFQAEDEYVRYWKYGED